MTQAQETHERRQSDHDHHHDHHHEHDHADCGCSREPLLAVEVVNLKTNDVSRFAVRPALTLAVMWAIAYLELGETRTEADILEDHEGHPLTDDLEQTVEWAAEHHNPCLQFQIHGEQGGA